MVPNTVVLSPEEIVDMWTMGQIRVNSLHKTHKRVFEGKT